MEWFKKQYIYNPKGELYLERYVFFRHSSGRALYLHRFRAGDWGAHLHDHPKWFLSVGLWGSYLEVIEQDEGHSRVTTWKRWIAPWFRFFPACHRHRIQLDPMTEAPVWTLVLTGAKTRDWGFWVDGKWVQWEEYEAQYHRGRFAGG